MADYNGPERRAKSDFEREVIAFMSRIDEHMRNQSARCDNHSTRIDEVDLRVTSLEDSRSYSKGIVKAVAVGVPAVGSITWFLFEVGKFIKEMRH